MQPARIQTPQARTPPPKKTNLLLIPHTIPIHHLNPLTKRIPPRPIKHAIKHRIDIEQPHRRLRIQLAEDPRHGLHRGVELRDVLLQLRALCGAEVKVEGYSLGVDA